MKPGGADDKGPKVSKAPGEPEEQNEKKNLVWKLLEELSQTKGITEIVINNPKAVFVEREGRFIHLNAFLPASDLDQFILEVARYNKRPCNAENPILDGVLPDGSRINIVNRPLAKGFPAITIRKYLKVIKSFDTLKEPFGLNPAWIYFLRVLMKAKAGLIISGGTGVGKTTFLNLLLQEIPAEERVVTIEDTLELYFELPNLVRLEAGRGLRDKSVQMGDLVKSTLRMRPDRIIVGEIRGGELFDFLQALNTGHAGSMSSIHSNSPTECIQRMETLFLLSGHDVPRQGIREQICNGIDFIIQLTRTRDGKRIVSHITELTQMEGERILTQHIGGIRDGAFKKTGITPKTIQKLNEYGLDLDYFNREF